MSNTKKRVTPVEGLDAENLWSIAWTYIKTVIDTVREPFLILDKNLVILSANKTFYSVFEVNPKETEGKCIYEIGNNQWDIPRLRILLEDILPKNTFFENFEVNHKFLKIGKRIMVLNARKVFTSGKEDPVILLAMEDVTKQKQLEDQLKKHTETLAQEIVRRTAELEVRIKELEQMNKIMINRELKMIELKAELKKLEKAQK